MKLKTDKHMDLLTLFTHVSSSKINIFGSKRSYTRKPRSKHHSSNTVHYTETQSSFIKQTLTIAKNIFGSTAFFKLISSPKNFMKLINQSIT